MDFFVGFLFYPRNSKQSSFKNVIGSIISIINTKTQQEIAYIIIVPLIQ